MVQSQPPCALGQTATMLDAAVEVEEVRKNGICWSGC